MKYILTLMFAVVFYTVAVAQSRTETVTYQKINRQAVVNDIPFPEKTVRDAIGKDTKGFTVYKGVRLPALGNDLYDLYFSADRKSRKEKEYATLTMMITKGIDNFVADSTDAAVVSNAKAYLDSIK